MRPSAPKAEHYNAGSDPSHTIAATGVEQRFSSANNIPTDWWRLFGSPDLDKVMADAFANSPTVQAAEASLRVSKDNLRAGEGVFFPQVNGGADATRQKFLPQEVGQSGTGNIFNLFTLTGTVGYTLDIFGGERRQVEALSAQVDAQRANTAAAYLALSGNLVNTVIARAAYSDEIDAQEKIIATQKEQIRYTQTQVDAGILPYSNLLSLQTQLSASEAALPPLKQSLTQTENLLAQLSGRLPASGIPAFVALPHIKLPVDLPITLPSELARKRPDIAASEAQLHSASAQIGVATAALFPSISLSGSYGAGNMEPSKLFTGASPFWNLGTHIAAPIFNGGTLWSERKAAIDAYDEAGANYKQTVLSAFAQVANTLRALEHDAEALDAQSHALATAEENLRLTNANYKAGLVSYVQVLIADGQYQQAEIGSIAATAQRLQDTVALYVALGGGWQNASAMKSTGTH
jgi:NodT family efflux transporter outer membrane factor (OMF) lipoprotein